MEAGVSAPELPLDPFSDRLLKSTDVAALFKVDPKTVNRWAKIGRIEHIRTPGGHVRFRESTVRAALLDRAVERGRDATS